MPLVDQPFADTFTFSRPRAATLRDATGALVAAAVDVPRFDHDADGTPLGLRVEGRPRWPDADAVSINAGDWAVTNGTVLHEYRTPAGEIRRAAWYSRLDPVLAVNGCLNTKGWHRRIAYLPVMLANRGGFVRWRNLFWTLGSAIAAEPNVSLGATTDILILEG